MMRFLIASLLFFPLTVFAAGENSGPPDLALGSLLASLLLVLVCIFVFAYLMKKTNLLKNGRGKTLIKVVATQPLSNKSRVQMLEVNGQHYLLGVTEQNITLLDKLDAPLAEENDQQSEVAATPFATLLSKISNKQ